MAAQNVIWQVFTTFPLTYWHFSIFPGQVHAPLGPETALPTHEKGCFEQHKHQDEPRCAQVSRKQVNAK